MVQVELSKASVNIGDKIGVVIHPKKLNPLGRARVCKNEWVAEELTITDLTLSSEADGNTWFLSGTFVDPSGEISYVEDIPINRCYPSKGEALRNLTD